MKIECKNCGHWLVQIFHRERPTPHLHCTCRRCGSVWVEKENSLFAGLRKSLAALGGTRQEPVLRIA